MQRKVRIDAPGDLHHNNSKTFENTNIVIASDTRRKHLRCASEAISKHVDNPLPLIAGLAMTKIEQNGVVQSSQLEKLFFC